jgi:hypothetical protein
VASDGLLDCWIAGLIDTRHRLSQRLVRTSDHADRKHADRDREHHQDRAGEVAEQIADGFAPA